VKNPANYPPYDLPANSFLREQVFAYHPISNVTAYENLLLSNGFILVYLDSIEIEYVYSSGGIYDIFVAMHKQSDGAFNAMIVYRSNPSLLSAITPTDAPLVQYQLLEFYVGERNFVIEHIDQYKSALKGLGFEEFEEDGNWWMEKDVGNCLYHWTYQHSDNYLGTNNGAIDYNWIIHDKAYDALEDL
jgi:hypothetical protein